MLSNTISKLTSKTMPTNLFTAFIFGACAVGWDRHTLYMSGQIGFKDGKLVKGDVKAEAKQALDNIHSISTNR